MDEALKLNPEQAGRSKQDGKMVGKITYKECVRNQDKRNPRISINKPLFEELICERMISFILSFHGG